MDKRKFTLQILVTPQAVEDWKDIVIKEKTKNYDIDNGAVFQKLLNNYKEKKLQRQIVLNKLGFYFLVHL